MQVFNQEEGDGVIFYAYRSAEDLYLRLPGRNFEIDQSAPEGAYRFVMDGIQYELVFNDLDTVLPAQGASTHADLLRRHANWERAYLQSMLAPLDRFEDLGDRPKAAHDGTPALLFKLWKMSGDSLPGVTQYYLTTVVGGEFVTLSAGVEDTNEAAFMKAVEEFSGSVRHLAPGQCPAKT
jgi:hypothetical protein